VQLAPDEVDGARRLERKPTREQPVEDHAEGVDVARRGHGLSGRLLGRHVGGGADQRSGLGQRVRTGDPRDAEVGDLGSALPVEDDVRRLQVAVDEVVLVRVREPIGDLRRDPLRLRVGERGRRLQAVLERSSGQVLEDHVWAAVCFPVVVQPGDVRMRQGGDGAGLALEACRIGVAA